MAKRYDEDMEIDLREMLLALRKGLPAIAAAALIGAVAAGIYTQFLVQPLYKSTSMMLVLTKETTLSSLADLQMGSQLTQDYSMLLRTRTVMQTVADNLDLNMDYRELERHVEINYPEDTRIMEITVTYPDPETAKAVADELADVGADFIEEQMEVVPPRIIEKGEVPDRPSSPSMFRNLLAGAAAGLVIAGAAVAVMSMADDTVKTADDIERYLGMSALAGIPDRKDYISGKGTCRKARKKKKHRRKRR